MFVFALYLTTLFVAPQLWIQPFVGVRVDLYIYPVWIVYLIASGKTRNLYFGQADKYFLLMIAWIVLSSFVNGFTDRSPVIIQAYIKWYLLFKLIGATLESWEDVRKFGLMLIGFALFLTVEGIQHKLSADGIGWAGQSLGWVDESVIQAGGTGRTRWINIFDGPGTFCVAYTIALPFFLNYLRKIYPAGVRLVMVFLTGSLLLAIFYTGSRGGFLASLAVVGLFLAYRMKISPSRLALIGGILFMSFMLAPAYLTSVRDSENSAQHRVDMWMEGVEMVQQNPVFGIGKGNYQRYTGRLIAHNSTIEIMGETGVPGLFFWWSLLYVSFKSLVYRYRVEESEKAKAIILALGISLAGYIISSMFVTLEYETLYILLGVCSYFGREVTKPLEPGGEKVAIMGFPDHSRIFVGIFAWILFLKVFFRLYY